MASPTQWIGAWGSSRSWWWSGRPGVLQSMGSQSQTQLSDWIEQRTELSSLKRLGNVNAYYWRCQSAKATDCLIPTIQHSEKGKTTETIKISILSRGEREKLVQHRKFLGWWNNFLWHYKWWIHITIHLSKPTEHTIPWVNPNKPWTFDDNDVSM